MKEKREERREKREYKVSRDLRLRRTFLSFFSLFSFLFTLFSCENQWVIAITDPLFEKEPPPPDVLYPIVLDITWLTDAGDIVTIDKDEAGVGQTVTISYTLANTDIYNQLSLTFASTPQVVINTPGNGTYTYAVNPLDVINGTIKIEAVSIHTDRIILDPPTAVSLTEDGTITFTEGANNAAAGCYYAFTLFRGDSAVPGFIDEPIASGGDTITALRAGMLGSAGVYRVRVKALATNADYTNESISPYSNAVTVYSVTVNIAGNGTDYIEFEGINYTSLIQINFFAGTPITLTAVPQGERIVTWSDTGTNEKTRIITVNDNINITAVFSNVPLPPGVFVCDNPVVEYDGTGKTASVTYIGAPYDTTTAGAITVYYGADAASAVTTPPVNAGTYKVFATTDGGTVYAPLTDKTEVGLLTITKADPLVTVWPSADEIIYGAMLSASNLTGGSASVPGTFAWTDGTVIPVVGSTAYSVTFTPTDTNNYNTVTGPVTITVLQSVTINIEFDPIKGTIDPDITGGSISRKAMEVLTVNLPPGFTNPSWFVDGLLIASPIDPFTINALGYAVGTHTITLVVQDTAVPANWYSATIEFEVTE